jgi:hypothetical protein
MAFRRFFCAMLTSFSYTLLRWGLKQQEDPVPHDPSGQGIAERWSTSGKPLVPSKRLGRHHAEADKGTLRTMRFHSYMAEAVIPCEGGWRESGYGFFALSALYLS